MNAPPQSWTVAQAVSFLKLPEPLPPAVLNKLGRDCALAARAMQRPIGKIEVFGKRWTHENTYTADVLREAFRLHPATRDHVPKGPQS